MNIRTGILKLDALDNKELMDSWTEALDDIRNDDLSKGTRAIVLSFFFLCMIQNKRTFSSYEMIAASIIFNDGQIPSEEEFKAMMIELKNAGYIENLPPNYPEGWPAGLEGRKEKRG